MCMSSKPPKPQAPPVPPSARDADQEGIRSRQERARLTAISGSEATDITKNSLADVSAPTLKPTLGA